MSDRNLISIVIPTYNRVRQVTCAIDSALQWNLQQPGVRLVIVDDASTDDTVPALTDRYERQISDGVISLVRQERNGGAAAAKNAGAAVADSRWILFLDSDDRLIADACAPVSALLSKEMSAPAVFFRCISVSSGALIGAPSDRVTTVTCKTYLHHWKWGECLPVVNAAAFARYPYEARLRGHEGISYARMMKHMGPAIVSPVVARIYDETGTDRLSLRAARARRAGEMALGYSMLMKEFATELGASRFTGIFARWAYYSLLARFRQQG